MRSSHVGYIVWAATRSVVCTAVCCVSCRGSISENVDDIAPPARVACPGQSPLPGPTTATATPRASSSALTARPMAPVPTTATS